MRLLVVAGASGGHIYPALSFLDTLKEKHKDIEGLLVLSKRAKVKPEGYRTRYLSITPLTLKPSIKNFVSGFNFIKGAFESLYLLAEYRPDTVVGFGSIDSLPLVLFAWLFRIKTLIHEQNVVPGRANKLLSRFADKIAVSFQATKDYLRVSEAAVVFTGNPVRRQIEKIPKDAALSFLGLDKDKFTILVVGGSQGSRKLNECFLQTLLRLPDLSGFQVIHLTGESEHAIVEDKYQGLKVKAKVCTFLKEMQYAYSVSDLVVCRAGATTIAELIVFRLPAVIIPYPFANAHQLKNAQVLKDAQAALVIEETFFDAEMLQQAILTLKQDANKLKEMQENYKRAFPVVPDNDLLVQEALNFN